MLDRATVLPAGSVWFFVIDSSLNMLLPPTVTTVLTDELLSNSLPSGMRLSGSTIAWFVIVPGTFGANTVMTMLRVCFNRRIRDLVRRDPNR